MKKYGLIGYPLEHSFSESYFKKKFKKEGINNCSYELYPLKKIEELKNLLKQTPGLYGLNVTIPYKISVIPFLDELDSTAQKIGAVNMIKIIYDHSIAQNSDKKNDVNTNSYLKGYNTDAFGFENSLKPLLKKHHNKALVLGTGGSSKAVIYILKNLCIDFLQVSRNPFGNQIGYSEITSYILNEYTLIINTTPAGMFPNIEKYPLIPYEYISEKHILYDLIYNPDETQFLKFGKERGASIKNGLEMLCLQADKSWEICLK